MKLRCIALLVLMVLAPYSMADDKPNDALVKGLKEADLIFTGKVSKVNPLGQTNSIPPSTFGDITFKEPKALRGTVPEAAKFSYSFREGTTQNLDLKADGEVLIAVKGKGVLVIVPASEANLTLAKKVIEAAKEK
jgi:hypothetical protein